MKWLLALPTILRILNILFDKYEASEDTKKKLRDLIASTKDDGLISGRNADRLLSHREKLEAEIKKGAK